MINEGKRSVLGVNVDVVDYEGAVQRIVAAAKSRESLSVSALAVHGVMTGVLDDTHRYRLNQIDLICPDGQPVRWALNLLHRAKLDERVYGPQLMLQTCDEAAKNNLSVFLFGGSAELLQRLARRLKSQFPTLRIAGSRPSKFRTLDEDEWAILIEEVENSGASILFVGLGCPRQEVFVFEVRQEITMPALAVGAAFNFHSGELSQAPPLMQRWGLEWLYRLTREPIRLWRRYILLNPAYLALLTMQSVGLLRSMSAKEQRPTTPTMYG